MCFGGSTPKAPKAAPPPPPPVTQSVAQVQDASDQERRNALLRRGQNRSMFAGTAATGELGQGQAGGQQPLKGLLG